MAEMIPVDPPYRDPEWLPASQVDCYRAGWAAARQALTATQSWAVTVERNGESVVTLSSGMLAGRDLSDEDERVIRMAGEHLLSFIGAVPSSPAQEATLARRLKLELVNVILAMLYMAKIETDECVRLEREICDLAAEVIPNILSALPPSSPAEDVLADAAMRGDQQDATDYGFVNHPSRTVVLRSRASSPVSDSPTRFFWVMERALDGSPAYWDGGHAESFTRNIHYAVQWRRKVDLLNCLTFTKHYAQWGWTPVEHGIMAPVAGNIEREDQRDIFIAAIRTLREHCRVEADCEAGGRKYRLCQQMFLAQLDDALQIVEASAPSASAAANTETKP